MSPSPLIALVGFMGSGKSTIGALLARTLDLPFVDLDSAIEEESGLAVHRWFAERGEAAFRDYERAALARACSNLAAGGVLALGGGAFSDPSSRALLAARGRTVWLDAPLPVLVARLGDGEGRPLFEQAERLYEARRGDYARADARVDVDAPPATVVERIRALVDR